MSFPSEISGGNDFIGLFKMSLRWTVCVTWVRRFVRNAGQILA